MSGVDGIKKRLKTGLSSGLTGHVTEDAFSHVDPGDYEGILRKGFYLALKAVSSFDGDRLRYGTIKKAAIEFLEEQD